MNATGTDRDIRATGNAAAANTNNTALQRGVSPVHQCIAPKDKSATGKSGPASISTIATGSG